MLMNISVYQVKWITKPNPWDPIDGLLDCPEQLLSKPGDSKWVGNIPKFEHQDQALHMPSAVSKGQTDLGVLSNRWILLFDGGIAN